MANKIAGRRRVNAVIRQFEAAGYIYTNWTEDGEFDSPKLDIEADDGGPMLDGESKATTAIIVAVERDFISVTSPENGWNWVNFSDVAAFLAKVI